MRQGLCSRPRKTHAVSSADAMADKALLLSATTSTGPLGHASMSPLLSCTSSQVEVRKCSIPNAWWGVLKMEVRRRLARSLHQHAHATWHLNNPCPSYNSERTSHIMHLSGLDVSIRGATASWVTTTYTCATEVGPTIMCENRGCAYYATRSADASMPPRRENSPGMRLACACL
jgi:hypothetical protein